MNPLELLEVAKKIWEASHSVGGEFVNDAGKKYAFIQSKTGSSIYDTVNGDTWDEMLVGLGGDVIQFFALAPLKGVGIIVDLTTITTDTSLGNYFKDWYKYIKSDVATQYWKYEKDFNYMVGGTMLHLDYAKVLYDRHGAIMINGEQVVQSTYELQYNEYMATKKTILDYIDSSVLNVKIENSGGVLKVTLPDGTIYAQGDNGSNTIYGASKNDRLYGMGGNDILYGNGGDDFLDGGIGNDTLVGGIGSDGLVGGTGNDTLMGTNGYGGDDGVADTLNGGDGYDTYIAGNGDTIYDSDGSGIIVFEGRVLHGVDVTMDSTIYPSNQYHTAYYSKADKGTYYRNGNTGFSFVSDTGKTLTVYSPLDYTEKVIPKPGGGTMTQKTYRGVGVTLENFSSPLVLDLNHDGVTSLDLYATPAYFDMEKDGIREKTGWIQSTDALLAFDKNRDGLINDSIELFAQLQVWNDLNQDASVQEGELQSLSEAGITSIDLNYVSTNINVNGNLLVEASKYTDTAGNKELAADIQLATDAKDTRVNIDDIPNFTIDPITNLLPQLRGSGLVYDSFIRYNMDPEFKAIANNLIQKKAVA